MPGGDCYTVRIDRYLPISLDSSGSNHRQRSRAIQPRSIRRGSARNHKARGTVFSTGTQVLINKNSSPPIQKCARISFRFLVLRNRWVHLIRPCEDSSL